LLSSWDWITKVTIVPGYLYGNEFGGWGGDQSYLGLAVSTTGHNYEESLVILAGPAAQKQFGDPAKCKTEADYFMLGEVLEEFKAHHHGLKSVKQYAEKLVELMVKQNWELITALAEHLLVVKEMDSDAAREFLVAAHQRLIREAHYPPEPVFDGLDAYEKWFEKHNEKLGELKEQKEKLGD
jgi:hypothetical protein